MNENGWRAGASRQISFTHGIYKIVQNRRWTNSSLVTPCNKLGRISCQPCCGRSTDRMEKPVDKYSTDARTRVYFCNYY